MDHSSNTSRSSSTAVADPSDLTQPDPAPSESTPLLSKHHSDQARSVSPEPATPRIWPKIVTYKILLTSFLVSLSFGVTQVPLIYVFGVMTCDEYYLHHPSPPPGQAYDDRCHVHAIEASTARAVALLGAGTTIFGVANLFITGAMIKGWGVKKALLVTIFWPAMRLAVQNVGVMTGAGLGIIITQLSQVITIIGGPAGYLLALTSFATEVVLPSERTATLGRLSGCAMFGTSIGFLAGGLITDAFGIIWPFRVAVVLFLISTAYGIIFLPTIPTSAEVAKKASRSLSTFFDPLKMFVPGTYILRNGKFQKEYGVLLLGIGAFMGIFATGYIPVLLQMYATDIYGFTSSRNSVLISSNFLIRACFLTFAFPIIIEKGRKWLSKRTKGRRRSSTARRKSEEEGQNGATAPAQLASTALPAGEETAVEPTTPIESVAKETPDTQVSYDFDLFYTRYSLILDGILTFSATFITKDYQLFIVAVILPLASGTGSAAKGTMLQMCTPEQKTDALSAISLVEMMARLSTTSIFGVIFSAFAEVGRPGLTFAVNAAFAILGFCVMLFARFPEEGSRRFEKDSEDDDDDGIDEDDT